MKINDVFDAKRFWKVLRIDLMDNFKIRLLAVALLGLVIPLFSLFSDNRIFHGSNSNENTYFVFGVLVIAFIGLFFSARKLNKQINTKHSTQTFYLLPASRFEKFISVFIITAIGYTIAAFGIIVCSSLVAEWINTTFLHRTLSPINFSLSNPTLITAFFLYLAFQSMFLFGGLFFKIATTIKTAVSIVILFSSYGYLAKVFDLPMASQKLDFTNDWLELVLFSVFFWLLTYIRLTETEGR